jgi:hypothetical protein
MLSTENSLDNAFRSIGGNQKDIHTNNPAEKVYKRGFLSHFVRSSFRYSPLTLITVGDPTRPTGIFGGYPYCYTVWEAGDFDDRTMNTGWWYGNHFFFREPTRPKIINSRFVQAPNSTVDDDWCAANAVAPTVLLPPHTAPLDMKFGAHVNDTNLYVSLHGSWNREPPQVSIVLFFLTRLCSGSHASYS